ncbi:MAG: Gfo/Idh/MocA family oxidoreductase [Bacteroidales bacterium]|nr:Gfo/Idh/MocA family oxidoreductase [Bacteroidales bacterium]
MKKVITYGTYDLLHQGHINLLRRAKGLGDYLIVGVTTDKYDYERGKLNVRNNVVERIKAIEETGLADKIIIEEYVGQKIDDIQKYDVDIFAVGSDWEGEFDYLRDYCEVVYLPRTEGVSSTQLREESMPEVRLGIIGTGSIARRMVEESKYVSGISITAVFNPDIQEAIAFSQKYNIPQVFDNIEDFSNVISAAYVASPHPTHYPYTKYLLNRGIHVLNELPFSLKESEARDLFEIADSRNLVLMDAIKTAYCPAFKHMVSLIKSGLIGEVVDVEAAQSTLEQTPRKLDATQAGGGMSEDASFSLLPIMMLLGDNYTDIRFVSKMKDGVDIYTYCSLVYPTATASFKIGLGIKTEGDLVVSGTKGYLYVPAPWWKPSYFEARFEDISKNKKYFYAYEGEGLRYELQEFVTSIFYSKKHNVQLPHSLTISMARVQEDFHSGKNRVIID